jgi:Flp pilus assembly pilin Flp
MVDHPNPHKKMLRIPRRKPGQALVEYALIIALVMFAVITVLSLTGPAVANVFSNTVFNLLNQTTTPRSTLNSTQFWEYSTWVATYVPPRLELTPNEIVTQDPSDVPPIVSARTYLLTTADAIPGPYVRNQADGLAGSNVVSVNTPLTASWVTAPPAVYGSITLNGNGSFSFAPSASFTAVNNTCPMEGTFRVTDSRGLSSTSTVRFCYNITGGIPPTPTQRPLPSPTPQDRALAYPFVDAVSNTDDWHYGFNNVLNGPWNVSYWQNTSFSGPPNDTDTHAWGPTQKPLDFDWGAAPPRAGYGSTGYSVQWESNVALDNVPYEVVLIADGPAEFTVGSFTLSIATEGLQTVRGRYTGGGGSSIAARLRYANISGNARVTLIFNRVADEGTCNWSIVNDPNNSHSIPAAFQDSPPSGAGYAVNSSCHLRLRGSIEIPTTRPDGTPSRPQLYFWERWRLAAGDVMRVGVREYNNATAPFTWVNVHSGAGNDLNWRRRAYDLTNFGGENFVGKRIEIVFHLQSDAANVDDGWYLDDIGVIDFENKLYFTGFLDSGGQNSGNWINECDWRAPGNVGRTGNDGWTDSPAANYGNNTNCALQLNGLVDLTSYSAGDAKPVELLFWIEGQLATATDSFYVETRPANSYNDADWVTRSVAGSSDPYVFRASNITSWTQYFVNLEPLKGSRFQLRFRLQADGDGNVAAGVSVDDVAIRERPITFAGLPFYEPFNNGAIWQSNGGWAVTAGADNIFLPYSPSTSMGGRFSPATDTWTELTSTIDLTGAAKPFLSFFTYWNVTSNTNLRVEIMDDNITWQAVPLWQRPSGELRQLAWQRFKINLTPFLNKSIRIRFRIQNTDSTATATSTLGWFIDDVRIEDENNAAVAVNGGPVTLSMDQAATAEDEAKNWFSGGQWQVTANGGMGNSRAWNDTPTGNSIKPGRSILEYARPFDLTGTTNPTLYFFQKFALGDTADRLHVDVSTDGGYTWNATPLWSSPETVNLGWHRVQADLRPFISAPRINLRFRLEAMNPNTAGDGWWIDNVLVWDRNLIDRTDVNGSFTDPFNDLTNWVAEGDWTDEDNLWSGWQYLPPSIVPQAANYDADGAGSVYPTINTSNWVADYWHVAASTSAVWTGTTPTWPVSPPDIGNDNSVTEVGFDYQADTSARPFPNGIPAWTEAGTANHEYYLIRYQRTLRATVPGEYLLRLRFAGGARVYLDGTLLTPNTTLGKPYVTQGGSATNPWQRAPQERSYFYNVTLGAAAFRITVEYYHTTLADSGPGKIDFRIASRSTVARSSAGAAPTNTYSPNQRTSLILNGVVTVPAGLIGRVGWQERFSLTDNDYAKTFYSLDEGFTWTEVLAVQRFRNNPQGGSWSAGSLQDWVDSSFAITNGGNAFTTPQRVMVKFELDARLLPAVDEGWLIDNFQFFSTSSIPNLAPLSSSISLTTTANVNILGTPTIADQAGDTHTLTVVSQPSRGVVTVVGNQFQYQPPADWTGDMTFTYQVRDQGSLQLAAPAVGTVRVNPVFERAYNLGPDASQAPALTVNGNNFNAMWSSGMWTDNTTGACDASLPLNPPATGTLATMLRCYVRANNVANPMTVAYDRGNTTKRAYAIYLWVVQYGTGTTPFDVHLLDDADYVRVASNVNLGGRGNYQRLGPFNISTDWSSLSVVLVGSGNNVGVAGMEFWRGAAPVWTGGDIGGTAVAQEGSFTESAGTFTVRGGGDDIWGTDDQFYYAYRLIRGTNIRITARVNWQTNPGDQWAKAGLMIRSSAVDTIGHASIFITRNDNRERSFQWRRWWGDTTQESSPGTTGGARPIWLRVECLGASCSAYYSNDGTTWTQQGTAQNISDLSGVFYVGLAITSHNDGVLEAAIFDNVTIEELP